MPRTCSIAGRTRPAGREALTWCNEIPFLSYAQAIGVQGLLWCHSIVGRQSMGVDKLARASLNFYGFDERELV